MEQINDSLENQWVVFNSTQEFVETKKEENFENLNLIKELKLKIKQLEYEVNFLKNSIKEKENEIKEKTDEIKEKDYEIKKLKQANKDCFLENENLKKNLEEQKIRYGELLNKLFDVCSKLEISSLKNPKNNS